MSLYYPWKFQRLDSSKSASFFESTLSIFRATAHTLISLGSFNRKTKSENRWVLRKDKVGIKQIKWSLYQRHVCICNPCALWTNRIGKSARVFGQLVSRTIAMYVHYKSLYISLPSSTLTHIRRWQRGRRLLKSVFIFQFGISRLLGSAVCLSLLKPASAKYAMNASSFKQKSEKLAEMGRRLVKKTWKLVISRCCFAEDGREMYQEL